MTSTGDDELATEAAGAPVELDALTSAVVEAARHAAAGEWGEAPRLYALARKAALESLGGSLPESVVSAPADALIPVEQDPLPEGEPAEVLAGMRWPADVAGCVLATEVVVTGDSPGDEGDGRQGRLTVGVLRGGEYACCLQFRDDDELIVGADLADDLVTALLGTF